MAKKIISLVIALAVVFSVATCALSVSAHSSFTKPEAGISFDLSKIKNLFDPSKWIQIPSVGDKNQPVKDTVSNVVDKVQDAVDSANKEDREPLVDFYFDYDVVRTLKWGIRFGHVPETTTEVVTEPVVEEETTEATTEQQVTIEEETPLAPTVVVTDAAPLADVEEVANTGDAGVATIVALSAVSAAAFVVAKKK